MLNVLAMSSVSVTDTSMRSRRVSAATSRKPRGPPVTMILMSATLRSTSGATMLRPSRRQRRDDDHGAGRDQPRVVDRVGGGDEAPLRRIVVLVAGDALQRLAAPHHALLVEIGRLQLDQLLIGIDRLGEGALHVGAHRHAVREKERVDLADA